jgi:hypothetical protein
MHYHNLNEPTICNHFDNWSCARRHGELGNARVLRLIQRAVVINTCYIVRIGTLLQSNASQSGSRTTFLEAIEKQVDNKVAELLCF